jgi:hypothetical protein
MQTIGPIHPFSRAQRFLPKMNIGALFDCTPERAYGFAAVRPSIPSEQPARSPRYVLAVQTPVRRSTTPHRSLGLRAAGAPPVKVVPKTLSIQET